MERFQFFTFICREKMGSNLLIETARNSKCPKVSTMFWGQYKLYASQVLNRVWVLSLEEYWINTKGIDKLCKHLYKITCAYKE